jgi:hypothetical protein
VPQRRSAKRLVDDIQVINEEGYDDNKYAVKRITTRKQVSLNML